MIFATLRGSLIKVDGHIISDQLKGTIGTGINVFEDVANPLAEAITTPSSFSAVVNE